MGSNYYKKGDWNTICDRCGRKRKASECRYNWQNFFVCADTCWEPRHPQDFVHGVEDNQTVPIVRPDTIQSQGSTTLSASASKGATTVTLTSVAGIASGDVIGIVTNQPDGSTSGYLIHWTFSDGAPSGSTVTLGSPLQYAADSGKTVYVPSLNNETWLTATTTATGL